VTADWLLGPQLQLPTVASHLELIERLLPVSVGALHTDLLRLRTRYAELAGWLHEDTGTWTAAAWWTNRAMESAREGDDVVMIAYLLIQQSRYAAARGDGRETIELARAAQQAGTLIPTVHACALPQEGHGLSLTGEAAECERKLDRALELAARRC
jgi:hypothetical protein